MKAWVCTNHFPHPVIVQVGDVKPDDCELPHQKNTGGPVIAHVEVPEVRQGVHVGETDPTLLWLLRRLGQDFGPRGVALVAAKLAKTELAEPHAGWVNIDGRKHWLVPAKPPGSPPPSDAVVDSEIACNAEHPVVHVDCNLPEGHSGPHASKAWDWS